MTFIIIFPTENNLIYRNYHKLETILNQTGCVNKVKSQKYIPDLLDLVRF